MMTPPSPPISQNVVRSDDSFDSKQPQAAAVLQAAVSRLFVSRHSASNTLSPAHLDRSQKFSALLSRSYTNSPSPRAQPHPSPQRATVVIGDLSVNSQAPDVSPRKNLSFSSPLASGTQSRTDFSRASPLAWAPIDSPDWRTILRGKKLTLKKNVKSAFCC